jgi:cytoskeletal protein CcmA (bactofilin family)
MKTTNDKIDGSLTITEAFSIHGMVTGAITVVQGGTLHLYGMCGGDLNVDSGGTAIICGMVVGNVRNKGTIEVQGTVAGSIYTRGAHYQQAPGAIVRGAVEA